MGDPRTKIVPDTTLFLSRPAFGLNWDPSHMVWQGVDPVGFILDFADRIYHVDCKDTKVRVCDGRRGMLSSHLPRSEEHTSDLQSLVILVCGHLCEYINL